MSETIADGVDARDINPVSPPEKWDYEADIVCVGGGGAGLCGAATFFAQEAKRKGLKTNRAAAFKHAYAVQSNAAIDPRLLATMIDRAHEVYDWSETQSWERQWGARIGDRRPAAYKQG